MRRRILAAATAALLAAALLPGAAMAALPGTIDQNVDHGAGAHVLNGTGYQTFTAGTTGALTHIELYCQAPADMDVYVGLTMAPLAHVAQCGPTAAWVDFVMVSTQLLAAGNQYTIAVQGAPGLALASAQTAYGGGEASDDDGALALDFAFRTYVLPVQTITPSWNPASVPPDESTPATLTIVSDFPAISLDPLIVPIDYEVRLMHLPGWFTPTGITCSAPIAPAACTVGDFQAGIEFEGDGTALTVTVVVQGTAAPDSEDYPDTGEGAACVWGFSSVPPPVPYFSLGMCDYQRSELGVGNVTPPPTATTGGSNSSGGTLLWWLPGGFAALLGMLLTLTRRELRRVR